MNNNYPVTANVKTMITLLKDNNIELDFKCHKEVVFDSINDIKYKVTKEVYDFAKKVVESEKYISNYKGKYKFEKLRDGYIGMKVTTKIGTEYIQSSRGKPYGFVVALPTDNNEIVIGVSYINEYNENFINDSIGLSLALSRAVERLTNNEFSFESRNIKSKSKKQIEHFENRMKAYFYPELFSVSRGSTPIYQKDWEEIHLRRI